MEGNKVVLACLLTIAQHKGEAAAPRRFHIHIDVDYTRLTCNKCRTIAINCAIPHMVIFLASIVAQEVVGLGDAKVEDWLVEAIMLEPSVHACLVPIAIVNADIVKRDEIGNNVD